MKKLIPALVVFVLFAIFIFRMNPAPGTEVLADHPSLNKCYLFDKPMVVEFSVLAAEGMDCAKFGSCAHWFAAGGGIMQKTQRLPENMIYKLTRVVRYSPGPTTPSDYYYFKAVSDPQQPDFYDTAFANRDDTVHETPCP